MTFKDSYTKGSMLSHLAETASRILVFNILFQVGLIVIMPFVTEVWNNTIQSVHRHLSKMG
jgi:hypothetical protein